MAPLQHPKNPLYNNNNNNNSNNKRKDKVELSSSVCCNVDAMHSNNQPETDERERVNTKERREAGGGHPIS